MHVVPNATCLYKLVQQLLLPHRVRMLAPLNAYADAAVGYKNDAMPFSIVASMYTGALGVVMLETEIHWSQKYELQPS